MTSCLYKVVVQCTAYCFLFFFSLQAMPDTTELPAQLRQELQQFREQDNLEKWLYARIDYVDKLPLERISFLMGSQQAAWRTYKTYDERLAWFNLLILQGYYQLQTGNILLSINAYESALEFYEAYPLPDAEPDIIDLLLKPLGNNYTRLADYNTALFIHRKTLALAQQQKQKPGGLAAIYSNMAICARWQGDIPLALQYIQAGVAKVDQHTALYGLLLSTWADVLTEQGRYDTAGLVVEKALHQLQGFRKDTNAVYWQASALQMAARIKSVQGKYAPALQYAQSALQLFNRYYPGARQREKAKVNVLLGDVALGTNKPQDALGYYQQALVWLLPAWQPANPSSVPSDHLLYSENTLTDALTGKAEALKRLGHPEAALDHYMALFMAGRKLRSAFFYTESKLKELQLTRGRADAAMQLAYGLWTQTQQKKYEEALLLIAELSKAQLLADERTARLGRQHPALPVDSIVRKVKRLQDAIIYYQHEQVTAPGNKNIGTLLQSAEYDLSLLNKRVRQQNGGDTAAVGMLTLAYLHTMFQRIPEGVTALEFFEGRDSSYIIEMDSRGIGSVQLLANGKGLHTQVQQFMQQWYAKGPAAMMNAPKQFYEQCYQLYAAIFSKYQWKPGRRYLLIPDGVLSYLPFDALLTNKQYNNDYRQWPWLSKQVALSQAYSLQTWYQQQTAQYAAEGFTGFFVPKGKDSKQPVLSVMQEYQSLQDMITGDYYMDSTATWDSFNRHTANSYVLHISSHAVSSAQDSFPYLQLYDQPFYLFDLRYRSFSPALVVLGACKTADGEWLAGEGVNSLSRGFTAAGAGGVVSGLWNVNDEAAISIVQEFYRQLQQGSDPAMALHKAKMKWLQQHTDNAMLQLPYYWAGLVYSGHLQPVAVHSRQGFPWYYVAAGGLLVLLAALVGRRVRRAKASTGSA